MKETSSAKEGSPAEDWREYFDSCRGCYVRAYASGKIEELTLKVNIKPSVDKEEGQKKQRLAAEGLDPEGQRVARAGRARSGLEGAS